jgi:hypothetical protein
MVRECLRASKPRRLLAEPREGDGRLLLYMAQKMALPRSRRTEGKQLIPADGVED